MIPTLEYTGKAARAGSWVALLRRGDGAPRTLAEILEAGAGGFLVRLPAADLGLAEAQAVLVTLNWARRLQLLGREPSTQVIVPLLLLPSRELARHLHPEAPVWWWRAVWHLLAVDQTAEAIRAATARHHFELAEPNETPQVQQTPEPAETRKSA